MPAIKLSFEKAPHFGEYNDDTQTITIFVKRHKSLKSLIKTFYHELYHAYEHKSCLNNSEFYAQQFEKFSKNKKFQQFAQKILLKAILKFPNPISFKVPSYISKRITQEIKSSQFTNEELKPILRIWHKRKTNSVRNLPMRS
jgi:hypothetical protein